MKKLFVLFAAVALVAAFTLPAAAADETLEDHLATHWNFYGSARVSTWYEGVGVGDDLGDIDTDNFNLALQGNSRIGARVNLDNGMSGRFEYGSGVNVRILWGEWNYGAGAFGVGQNYTPYDTFYSNQVWASDEGLLSTGGIYTGRRPMLQWRMAGFKVALLQATTNDLGTETATEAPLPAFEASYGFTAGPASMKVVGLWQTYKIGKDTVLDSDISTWSLGLGGKFDVGAVALWGDIFYGQNLGNYGVYHQGNDEATIIRTGLISTGVEDTDSWGGILGATFKATDMLAFELGGGYTGNTNNQFDNDNNIWSLYANLNITLAPGFYIIPELGYYDYGDTAYNRADGTKDAGDLVYAGAKFQINF
jgi:hypothetical protein